MLHITLWILYLVPCGEHEITGEVGPSGAYTCAMLADLNLSASTYPEDIGMMYSVYTLMLLEGGSAPARLMRPRLKEAPRTSTSTPRLRLPIPKFQWFNGTHISLGIC